MAYDYPDVTQEVIDCARRHKGMTVSQLRKQFQIELGFTFKTDNTIRKIMREEYDYFNLKPNSVNDRFRNFSTDNQNTNIIQPQHHASHKQKDYRPRQPNKTYSRTPSPQNREIRNQFFDYEEFSTPIKDDPGVVRSFQDIQRDYYNSNSNYGSGKNTYSNSRTSHNNARPSSATNHSASGKGRSKGNIIVGVLFGLWGIWGLTHGALNHIGSIIIMIIFFAIAWSNLFKK